MVMLINDTKMRLKVLFLFILLFFLLHSFIWSLIDKTHATPERRKVTRRA